MATVEIVTYGSSSRARGFSAKQTETSNHEEGPAMDCEIESVARALHSAEEDAHLWEREPEIVKEEFRFYARAALEMLIKHRRQQGVEAEPVSFPYAA
jgi:hypothetical protein